MSEEATRGNLAQTTVAPPQAPFHFPSLEALRATFGVRRYHASGPRRPSLWRKAPLVGWPTHDGRYRIGQTMDKERVKRRVSEG